MTEEIREGTVEEEIAALDGEIKCMEAELAEERAPPFSRDEIAYATAQELVRKEQRKAILLRPTSATKKTRLELRERQYNLHTPWERTGRRTSGCGGKTTSRPSAETRDSASPRPIVRRTERVRTKQAKLQTCWRGYSTCRQQCLG